jgi:hypothetical protein
MIRPPIYLRTDLGQVSSMAALTDTQHCCSRHAPLAWTSRTLLLGELALSASFFAAPAYAQPVKMDVVGSVAPSCSGGQPFTLAGQSDQLRRSVTVRCSGSSPALSVRATSLNAAVTLTALGAGGQTGTTSAASDEEAIRARTLGARLSASEGNLTVQIADLLKQENDGEGVAAGGIVEIVVSPEV